MTTRRWLGDPGRGVAFLLVAAATTLPCLLARTQPPPPTAMTASLAGTWVRTTLEAEARADTMALQLLRRVAEALPQEANIEADWTVQFVLEPDRVAPLPRVAPAQKISQP